ncbi:MAG: funZ protein [Caldilineaceae bacterium]|nr:funZ protein [Caldilineaceae bacterium]
MKKFSELNLGFSDAENYKRRENKHFFNSIFVRSDILDRICDQRTFFLIGEKGTGKTAYAVYLANNTHRNTSAILSYIRETEYQQFVNLKEQNHLALSDYTHIWKVIIYLLMAEKIAQDNNEKPIFNFAKFRNIKNAIDDYYENAFSPEIIQAMNFVDQASLSAKLVAQYAEVGGDVNSQRTFTESRFQTNLFYIQRQFEEALRSIKLNYSHILFIDGIDIRPSSIEYTDYLECVKGLANAIWSINNDFFSGIKDSPGRMRVILLVRPDIFDSIGLQNQNNKVRDNSVMLDWRTTYEDHRSSMIFEMADKMLRVQSSSTLQKGEAWDYYFSYQLPTTAPYIREYDPPFISFLRYSLYRPRDIVTMLGILQENYTLYERCNEVLTADDFKSGHFQRKYTQYLLGEVKDQLSFYYSTKDYEMFLKFFQYLKGEMKFDYREFIDAYDNHKQYMSNNNIVCPAFLNSPDIFLQFLYQLNVISYIEDPTDFSHRPFISWCFRERTPSNISPKVKAGVRYEIHYGLSRSLRIGKSVIQ